MSIILNTDNARICFCSVFGFDTANISKGELTVPKGLKIKVEGTSALTKKKSDYNCGSSAIEDLSPVGFQTNGSAYFKNLRKAFENAGHIVGLTFQAIPYDFRLDYQKNELNTRFKGIIKELSGNIGKKVVIYAHSFGNYQTIHNLSKMTQTEKDSMIARYIALAPPFLGSPKTVEG